MDALDPRLRPAGPGTTAAPASATPAQSASTAPAAGESAAAASHHPPPQPAAPSYAGSAPFSPSTPSSVSTPAAQPLGYPAAPAAAAAAGAGTPASATPGSQAAGPHGGDHHDDGPGGPDDPKKPRACEACRGLKVRCEPDPANPDGPCRRCAKAGRGCVVTQPTRKRQKKTDSRVAELEKKIDALTATLSATRGGGGGPGPGPASAAGPAVGAGLGPSAGGLFGSPAPAPEQTRREWGVPGTAQQPAAGLAVRGSQQRHGQSPFTPESGKAVYPPPMVLAGQKRKHTEPRNPAEDAQRERVPPVPPGAARESSRDHEYSDIVDRGVITMDRAGELWRRYNESMAPQLPGVIFPEGYSAAELRKARPTLFLSVMAAASSESPNVQRVIVKELMQTIADKVVVTGEKSIELVQAIQVAIIWYWPPEHFEELKFYQLVHMAAVMAIDIGLGRRKPSLFRRHLPYTWRDHPFRKNPPPDPTGIEGRRAWLTCYFLTSNTAMALHRPNLVRWTAFMTECMDVLETSPEAAPSDRYLCHLVWTHHLAEEIGVQFSMDDPGANINIADPRTQYALRGFERELHRYQQSVPPEMMHPSLSLSLHVLNLYMHEIALQNEGADEGADPGKPAGLNADSLAQPLLSDAALTPAHIDALSACLTAIDGIFETFLGMDVATIRCLPAFNFVRVAYATVVLIKMYFAATSPRSELGKVINRDHMKVEQHLDALLDKFRATAADDRCRPATKFLVVLVMIRSWFQKQGQGAAREGGAGPASNRAASATPPLPPPPQQQQQQEYAGTANTPLQLLSEVATNNHAAASSAPGTAAGAAAGRPLANLPGNFYFNQPFMYTSAAGAGAGAGDASNNPANPAQQQQQQQQQQQAGGQAQAQAQAQAQSQGPPGMLQGNALPWLNSAFAADFDYSQLMDANGLGQAAVDMTLAGMGAEPYGDDMRYISMDPWFTGVIDGMPGGGLFQF